MGCCVHSQGSCVFERAFARQCGRARLVVYAAVRLLFACETTRPSDGGGMRRSSTIAIIYLPSTRRRLCQAGVDAALAVQVLDAAAVVPAASLASRGLPSSRFRK